MSRKQEKQTPIALLKDKLKMLGFENDLAAKNLLKSLANPNVPGEVVEDVNNMVSIAVSETKKKLKKALQALADTL